MPSIVKCLFKWALALLLTLLLMLWTLNITLQCLSLTGICHSVTTTVFLNELNIYQCLKVCLNGIQVFACYLLFLLFYFSVCHQHLHSPLFKSIWQQKHTVQHTAALSFLFKIIYIYSFQNSYHILCTYNISQFLFQKSWSLDSRIYNVIMSDVRHKQNTSV